MKCEGEGCLTETRERETEQMMKISDPSLLSEEPTEIIQVSEPKNFLKSDPAERENTSQLLEPRRGVTEQNTGINVEILTEIDQTIQDGEPSSESWGRNETLIDSRDDLRVCTLSQQVSVVPRRHII